MRRVVWQHWLPWLIYGLLYPFLMLLAAEDDIGLGYPFGLICWFAICDIFNWVVIITYAFHLQMNRLRTIARIFFPISVLSLIVGLVMDAVLPSDYSLLINGWAWITNSAIALLLASPAYVAGFKVAYGTHAS